MNIKLTTEWMRLYSTQVISIGWFKKIHIKYIKENWEKIVIVEPFMDLESYDRSKPIPSPNEYIESPEMFYV